MSLQQVLKESLTNAISSRFSIEGMECASEAPPRTELGDLAFPAAFELAKQLKARTGAKHSPRELAARLAEALESVEGIDRVEVAGAGYINVFFDRVAFLRHHLSNRPAFEPRIGGKIIVEHTSVNPNKAAHIGHVRNAVLGDTTVRLLRAAGEEVEVQNYVDNTGVQVADVVVGFRYMENLTLDQIKTIEGRFDYYCWDLYARVGKFYAEDPARRELRERTLHEIESGKGEVHEMAEYVSTRILGCHLDTMYRINVTYDLLPRESDVLHLHLWEQAFALLKEKGAIELAREGRLAGCWVMRASEDLSEAGDESEHEADKVIVRSNRTVTYTGKDIAFHLWKLGWLQGDFLYRPFRSYDGDKTVWITTSQPSGFPDNIPRFGRASAYFNVIDVGQSYPQTYVKLAVTAVGDDERVRRSAHLAYEKVVLSAAAAEQLGQSPSEDEQKRGRVAMAGRKGLGVKADDLIDQLESSALREVAGRHPDLGEHERLETARKIATGALRYFLLKYTRNSIIAFDFKEALAFDGETGPYLQYSVVRANSIFRKLEGIGYRVSSEVLDRVSDARLASLLSGEQGDDLWSLIHLAERLSTTVDSAIATLEPAVLARWAFQLARRFNLFYQNYRILQESDADRQALLIAIVFLVRRELEMALELLGIEVPELM